MSTYQTVLDQARSTLGESGKPTRDWYRTNVLGNIDAWPEAWAWCAAWVCRVMAAAGMPHASSASCGRWIEWARARGEWHPAVDGIRVGDVAVFDWEPPANVGEQDHIGLVTGVGSGVLRTLEGNAADRVRECDRAFHFVVGFYRPRYVDGRPDDSPAVPVVSLSTVQSAARADTARPQGGQTPGAGEQVKVVEFALAAEGLLGWEWAGDGSFGSKTVGAYSRWQQRLGYTGTRPGQDADGVPGRDSLTRLGSAHGFVVVD